MKNELICLGTGDGWPCSDRGHAAFVYRIGPTCLLIDCGEPLDGRFKASGLSYNLIDAAFLSHLHADHFGGLFMFLQGSWLEGRTKALPLHMPAGAVRPMRGMLDAAMLFDQLLGFRVKLKPIRPEKAACVGELQVTAFPTSHLDGLRARFHRLRRAEFVSYCFLIEGRQCRIGHSADLGKPEDLEPLLQKPLDLLVCELSHFASTDIFSYLKGREIGRVVFVHLGRNRWENLAQTRRLAARALGGIPHTFARDGDTVEF